MPEAQVVPFDLDFDSDFDSDFLPPTRGKALEIN
jgi:hypothetical protein